MIDQLFMNDLARELAPPLEPVEQPATLLAAGPATSDVGQVTVQGFKPGQETAGGAFVGTRLNTPKAGQAQPTLQDREKLSIGLLDSLAGALRGAVAQTIGLPGDIRSIVDMINKEGAEKYLGKAVLPTTEQMLASETLPPVLGEGATNVAERLPTVQTAEQVGTFLPAPGIPEAAIKGAKLIGKAIKATENLPVGLSTKAVGEGVDQMGFYSAARQAVDAIQQPKGTGDQFLKQIEKTPGVKPDEIKWTGLDDFLKSKKSVTKAEIQEFLDKNRIEIKEVQLGNVKLNDKSEYALPAVMKVINENQGAGFERIRLALVNDYDAYQALTKKFPNLEDTDNWGDRVLEDIIGAGEGGTKFSKFTVPGGENYREIYMTLPPKTVSEEEARAILGAAPDAKLSEADIFYASRKKQDDYIVPRAHSSGMNEGDINRIAHLRVNDRVTDGKKTLFVEEVQSDWHQAGRKKGYQGDMSIEQARQKMLDNGYSPEAVANSSDEDIVKMMTQYGVPNAPFKTTWSELAMKRAIQLASEGGYDRIAFTSGKIQNERYNLSSQINEASAIANKDGTYNLVLEDKSGNEVAGFTNSGKRLTPQELEETVGKDLAEKLIKGADSVKDKPWPKSASVNPAFFNVRGVDLDIGGEGMKGFYDDILPKFLNKYGKKWDAKVGKTEIDAGGKKEPVNYIEITPKMRESVLTKGQPMFAVGAGGAGAAATQQEENK